MEYFGNAKNATEQSKIANVKEEIELVILEEKLRANSGNNEFNYENVWDELKKKDKDSKAENNPEGSNFIVFYKGYNFLVDNNEVIHINEQTNITSSELIPLGPITTADGITYIESYEIWNKKQLETFRDRVNNGESFEDCMFMQKANINLNNEEWEPIGYGTENTERDKNFAGRYDGENHTISGIYINNNKMYQALFGDIWVDTEGKTVIIENLTVEGNVTGGHIVAGLVGRAGNAKIINCKNKVNVRSTLMENIYGENTSSTGGIVGRSAQYLNVDIIDCENYGTVNANYGAIGGIVGMFQEGNITGCKNYADIGGTSTVGKVGGIVGFMTKGKIERCYNTKEINGGYYTGGICGLGGDFSQGPILTVDIKQCNNTGYITGECYVGGIAGWLRVDSTSEQCSNAGDIKAKGCDSEYWSYVGGIIGFLGSNSKISDCYNTGNIESEYRGIGGILGGITGKDDKDSYIRNCYNIGEITNKSSDYQGRTGGIWGRTYNTMDEVTNCWQLENCIKQGEDTDQIKVENKTENEIKALNWTNYTVVEGKNDGYPILNWENN